MATKKTTAETPNKEAEAASEQTPEQVIADEVAADLHPLQKQLDDREKELDEREAKLDEREAVLSQEKPSDMTRAQAKAKRELKAMDNDRKKRAGLESVVTPQPIYRLNEEKE
jgi:flagellar motility protein MotE (MotC chaperone)